MRVAVVSFAFGEYSVRLAGALSSHAEVGLWLSDWQAQPHQEQLPPDVRLRAFRKPRLRHPVQQIRTIDALRRQIHQFRPDVVHLQQGYLWFNPVLRFLKDCALVVTVHDPTPHLGDRLGGKTPQFMADIAYRAADAVIVHNDEMKAAVVAQGVAKAPIHVIPHVILGDPEAATDIAEDGNRVLFFGRIWPYKGLEYLIQAEPLITAAVPDARIVIAGKGEDFSRYRQMMVHPDRFEVRNEYIPFADTAGLFQRCSVVALPYVDATQSGVIPMAYNFARPVVATTVGGLPSMIDDGETGYLVAPRDVRGLANAIIRLLQDPALRSRLGDQGKRKAETEYSPAAVAEQTLAVYRTLVGA